MGGFARVPAPANNNNNNNNNNNRKQSELGTSSDKVRETNVAKLHNVQSGVDPVKEKADDDDEDESEDDDDDDDDDDTDDSDDVEVEYDVEESPMCEDRDDDDDDDEDESMDSDGSKGENRKSKPRAALRLGPPVLTRKLQGKPRERVGFQMRPHILIKGFVCLSVTRSQ